MRAYDVAFYFALFFLVGVFLASVKIKLLGVLLIALLLATLFLIAKRFIKRKTVNFNWLAGLTVFIFIGAFYILVFENYQKQKISIPFGEKKIFPAKVEKITEKGEFFKFYADLQSPYSGKILIKTNPAVNFEYGDILKTEGKIEKPQGNYALYLEKDGVYGIVNYPKLEFLENKEKLSFKAALFSLKEKIISVFDYSLPPQEAAFMAGLTLGDRSNFSKEFKDKMAQSGTTHLIALSGYNIGILVIAVSLFLKFFFSNRKLVFGLSILAIFAFVIMTGAEASVVRAAIMGGILLTANYANRLYSMRNALVLTAFFMVLANPKILSFDIGFQLSFLAFLGIVYFEPAIKTILKLKDEEGFFSWRQNLITTVSAQIAVLPILINNFGQFSFFSVIANMLILSFIPVTMGLGFLLALIGFLFSNLAIVFGWFVRLLLEYELFIINIFSKLNFSPITKFAILYIFIYYVILFGFIYWVKKR